MRERIHIDTAEWFRPPEHLPHLDIVQRAVWDDRCIDVLYTRSDNGVVRRRLEPSGLVAKAGVWYMVAAMSTLVRPIGVARVKTARRQLQVYRISRLVEANMLEEQFERPEWLNLQEYWERWQKEFQDSLPRYATRIRLSPDILPLMPRLHGEGVRALISGAAPPDHNGWIEITLVFQSREEACISILGLGANAEVIEPAELHTAVLQSAERVIELYGSRP
jgi:predicted DNA-binding transcriptional regulator YafY